MPSAPKPLALIQNIAASLGPTWRATAATESWWTWELTEPRRGRTLTLYIASGADRGKAKKGRLVINGHLPPVPAGLSAWTDLEAGAITCDPARGAAVIARDIQRRLLPGYDAARRQLDDRVRQQKEQNARRDAFARHLAQIPGVERQQYNQDPNYAQNLSWAGKPWPAQVDHERQRNTPRAQISANWTGPGDGAGVAKVELTGLSAEQVERVLRALAGYGSDMKRPAPASPSPEPLRAWEEMTREDFTDAPVGLFPAPAPVRKAKRSRHGFTVATGTEALF